MTYDECDPGFRQDLERIAREWQRPIAEVWSQWQRYESRCESYNQSAVMDAFQKTRGLV